jgi:hypothetical protein
LSGKKGQSKTFAKSTGHSKARLSQQWVPWKIGQIAPISSIWQTINTIDRLRVGRYRVFFNVCERIEIVLVEEVKKRDERTY